VATSFEWNLASPPNGLELSCPAEAGSDPITVRQAIKRFKSPIKPSPPAEGPRRSSRGVSRRPFVPDDLTGILVIFQGFSELLGGDHYAAWRHYR
jgi:hypothetical protein